jgi:hypothetical protein
MGRTCSSSRREFTFLVKMGLIRNGHDTGFLERYFQGEMVWGMLIIMQKYASLIKLFLPPLFPFLTLFTKYMVS